MMIRQQKKVKLGDEDANTSNNLNSTSGIYLTAAKVAQCIQVAANRREYGTTRFQTHHMNAVLVEACNAFKIASGNIIVDSFAKTHILPLIQPNIITNTQAMVASVQISLKGINWIAKDTSHWTGKSITHHLDTCIETGGLRP